MIRIAQKNRKKQRKKCAILKFATSGESEAQFNKRGGDVKIIIPLIGFGRTMPFLRFERYMRKQIFTGFTLFFLLCATAGCGKAPDEDPPAPTVSGTEDGGDAENATGSTEAELQEEGADAPEADAEAATVPILRDAVREKLGGFAGCAVTGQEIDDPKVWEIVTTHFEAVTLGNELKPDALVGYSVSTCPGTVTEELNGESIRCRSWITPGPNTSWISSFSGMQKIRTERS